MTSLQLTYLLEVARFRSFSQAADSLHITQPSVSVQITRLEQELGFQIFDRSHKTALNVTPGGQVFLDGVLVLKREYGDLIKKAADAQVNGIWTARIGFLEAWDFSGISAWIMRVVEREFPGGRLYLEAYSFREMTERLEDNRLDAIFSVRTAIPPADYLEILPIGATDEVVLYRAGHAAVDPSGPTLTDFLDDTFLVLPECENPLSTDSNQSYFLSQTLQPKIREVPNLETMVNEIAAGNGFGVFDSMTRYCSYDGLKTLALNRKIPVCVARKSTSSNALVDLFCRCMQEHLRGKTLETAEGTASGETPD